MVLAGWLSQLFLITATSLAKPSKTMPLGYVTVIFGFLADIYLFKIKFTLLPIFGMLLTSVGLLSDFIINKKKDKKKQQEINDQHSQK